MGDIKKTELIVIGGGPGGYVCAMKAAMLGKKVVLIEKDKLGGTCLNRGCIPTKAILHSSGVYQSAKNSAFFGINTENVTADMKQIQAYKNKVVKTLTGGVGSLLKARKVEVVYGSASFAGEKEISVQDSKGTVQRYTADNIVIAAGSIPAIPPIDGINGKNVVTSTEALDFDELPSSLAVIGGGVIGMELGTAYSELGVKVIVIEALPRILAPIDEDIANKYKDVIKNSIEIHESARVMAIKDSSNGNKVVVFNENDKEQSIEVEKVLVAVGRRSNTADLMLEKAGVKTDRGKVIVDDQYKTNVSGIYCIGDANGKTMLAHVASAQGIAVAEIIANKQCNIKQDIIPSCVYTHPEISAVGMTEKQAKDLGKNYKVGLFPLRANGRSLVLNSTSGLVKIIGDADTNEVLGVHIIGEYATEMITECASVMRLEGCVEDIADTIHAHPTVSESVMEAAENYLGGAIHSI